MKHFIFVCIAVMTTAFVSYGAAVNDMSVEHTLPVIVQERSITDEGLNLTLGFNEVVWSTVGSEGEPVELAEVYGGQMLEEEGFPPIPVAGRLFRLPPRSGVTIEIINAEYETYSDLEYAICTYGDDQPGMIKDRNPVDKWYPENIAVIGEPAIFGDFRVTNLVTYPVQVNTARREVRVYNNLEIKIHYEGIDERNALDRNPTRISEAKLPLYRLFLDWDDSELDEYTLYRGGVQVIMRDDEGLVELMEPWFEWKLQRGWDIQLLTDDDVAWNSNAIKSELEDRYEEAETPFDYVVIIGDDTGPYSVMPASAQSDHPYTLLAGNDQMPEVGLGRISIQNRTQLLTYINKVFAYERDPDLDNTDWYLRGMVNNSRFGFGGITKRLMLRYIRHAMLDIGYTQVDTSWDYGGPRGNGYAIGKINDGVSLYAGLGYCNAGINANQIMGLTNAFMTPVTIDVGEQTGTWSHGTGISEAYMRAGTPNSPRGGICGMGTAYSVGGPDYYHVLSSGAAWAMLDLRMLTIGDMKLTATFNGWQNYETANNTGWRYMARYFNLMGDPTVWVWTGIPQELTVTAEDEIILGTNNYEVSAEDEDGNPITGAWVTFYKVDDDEQIIVRGISNEEGFVSLGVPVRFAGNGMLTVSKQHFAPTQIEVEVVSPNARVGFTDITIIDDGENGTVGNDNGIPEAGETVGLQIQARNYGNARETNIEFSCSSDEEWIDDITGSVTFGSLNPGQTATGTGLILIAIASEAQNEWILHLDIEAETDARTYEDSYPITVAAPQFVVADITSDDEFEPGETVEITIELRNVGHSNADAATGILFSNEAFVQVLEDEADFDAMDVEESASGTFEISLHEETIPGYYAHLRLNLITESGQVDTVGVILQLGEKSSTDPSGPDEYGYYAFDNTDDGYEDYVPTFEWIEINPDADDPDFDGDELDLSDGAENQDESIVIELPFTVQYYGEEFDTATICTNGWIAMGSQGDMFHSRNWTIPAPDGPNYMIAAFWDDLRLTGDGNVYTYYDQQNGRFIVEWYDVTAGGHNNRFEVIFYSQQIRPTYSGDTDILFQYDDVGPSTGSMQYDVPYWTTGIENGNQDGGLLYYYYNIPAPGAVENDDFDDGLVILFSANVAFITGTLEGTVTDLATGDPMQDILAYTTDTLFSAVTDEEGFYRFEEQPIGHWKLFIDIDCYNPISNTDIEVLEDQTTVVDFAMRHPEIALDPTDIDFELAQDTEETLEITLSNNGNGLLEYATEVFIDDPCVRPDPTTEPWNNLYAFDLSPDESRYFGIVFIGRNYFISGSDNMDPTGPNKIYKYDNQGRELLTTYNQPVLFGQRSAEGMRGLAWDGEYLYGVDDEVIYQMEFQRESIFVADYWDAPLDAAHFLEWDPVNDLFWMGDYNSDIYGIDRNGEVVYQYEREFIPRGAAWNPNDESGRNLYLFSQLTSRDDIQVVRMNPESGESNLVHTVPYIAGRWGISGVDFSSTWNPLVHVFSAVINQTEESYVQVWYYDDNDTFFSINNPDGTVNGGEENIIEFLLRSTGLPTGSYSIFVGFDNNACEDENNYISITMTLPDTTDEINDPDVELPLDWSFDGAYPNPFNQTLTVRFALKETAIVRMKIYNLLGQEVAELADLSMTAGRYALPFDGSGMASGMYFLSFEAGPLNETRKIVLLK
ncbi:MAG: C25 family cysteine peptidase [Candidatus Electryonea clarkiae]|nr:C25 family cysteine peptidase [Candidatus Electryonea clarkiae]MDP8285287.1 C25 family cysteine peptidase [Candidatus Electryonea clarkiae]